MTLKFKIFSVNRRRFSNLSMLVEVNFHETSDCHKVHNEIIAVSQSFMIGVLLIIIHTVYPLYD